MNTCVVSLNFWKLVEQICPTAEQVYVAKENHVEDFGISYDCYVLTPEFVVIAKIIDSESAVSEATIIHESPRKRLGEKFIANIIKKNNYALARKGGEESMPLVEEAVLDEVQPIDFSKAPAFYKERGIPKARWMYPGKAYKARLMTVPFKYEQAVMYIYVINEKYVVAFRDPEWQYEIGMLKLEGFLRIQTLPIDEPPRYQSVCPISLTYGKLLEFSATEKNAPLSIQDSPIKSKVDRIAPKEEPSEEAEVKVVVLPPDPPQKYEQLSLF